MRARLTVRFVVVVALALLVGGLGSVLLAARQERRATAGDLRRQALSVADGLDEVRAAPVLKRAAALLRLQGAQIVRIDAQGQVTGTLPRPLTPRQVDITALRSGLVTSGLHRSVAYAMAPVSPNTLATSLRTERTRPNGAIVPSAPATGGLSVVVLTRAASPGIGRTIGYLVLSGAFALLVAAAVGDALGRRLALPIYAAAEATRRIAGGDLTARVELRPGEPAELRTLAANINTMATTLAATKDVERQFLLSISHDLRTPLTSIRGFADAIADGTADDVARAAGIVASEAQRLERLVADLLELAKLEGATFAVSQRSIDIIEVVVDTAISFTPTALALGITLDLGPLEATTASLPVVADPERLAQVVANLVENAIGHAHQIVAVRVVANDSSVSITVDDDGPGIPEAARLRVFERRYQLELGDRSGRGGSGLGLAIVGELVAAMGATVCAESSPCGGARMHVVFRQQTDASEVAG